MESTGGISTDLAISELDKYETTMTNLIEKCLPSIQELGVSKYLETGGIEPLYGCFYAAEGLCTGLECKSSAELMKKLENLSMKVQSGSDAADSIESYFQVETKWSKFLEKCDNLLDKEENANVDHPISNLLDTEVELLDEANEAQNKWVKLRDILSTHRSTWFIFLRHYT